MVTISLLESLGTGSSAWLAVPFCPQSLTVPCIQHGRVHGHLSALTQGSITPLLPTVSCGRTPWCMSEPGCPVTDVPLRFPCPPVSPLCRYSQTLGHRLRVRRAPSAGGPGHGRVKCLCFPKASSKGTQIKEVFALSSPLPLLHLKYTSSSRV